MGVPKFSEVIVIRYSYEPDMGKDEYSAWMKSRKFKSSGTTLNASDWYARIIFRERYMLPPRSKILFSEWRVEMGYKEFFTFGKILYDQAILVFGAELCFWVYFKANMTARREEGSGVLDFSCCSCCLHDKCLEIAKKARKLVKI